jgi:hypothetical protein
VNAVSKACPAVVKVGLGSTWPGLVAWRTNHERLPPCSFPVDQIEPYRRRQRRRIYAARLGKNPDRDEKSATSALAVPAKAGTHGSAAANAPAIAVPYQRSQARALERWTPAFRRGSGLDLLSENSWPAAALIRLELAAIASWQEHFMNPYSGPRLSSEPCRCRTSLPTRLLPPVIACFPSMESRNLDDLILISLCLAREACGRRFGARPAGRSGDWSGNQKENLAADSLQIAQTLKGDSIDNCRWAASPPRTKPPRRYERSTLATVPIRVAGWGGRGASVPVRIAPCPRFP